MGDLDNPASVWMGDKVVTTKRTHTGIAKGRVGVFVQGDRRRVALVAFPKGEDGRAWLVPVQAHARRRLTALEQSADGVWT